MVDAPAQNGASRYAVRSARRHERRLRFCRKPDFDGICLLRVPQHLCLFVSSGRLILAEPTER